jgi:hypothetical protein
MLRRILTVVAVTTIAATLAAQTTTVTKADAGKTAPKVTLADFAWLVGNWRAEMKEGHVEQMIWPARGGEITGMFQLWNEDKTLAVELFALRETLEGVEMRIRHFTSELKPWEKEPIVLTVTENSATRTVFTNLVNNDPKRTIATRNPDGSFTSRVEMTGTDGKEETFELTLQRVK